MNEKGIIQDIKLLLRSLKEIRHREKFWKDNYEKSSKKGVLGFVKDLEALQCFLEYYEMIDEKRKDVLSDVFLDDVYLVEDINNIMKIIKSKGYPATPYLEIEEGEIREGDTDFIDSISFVITTFLDFRSYVEKRKKIRGVDLSDITQIILDSLHTLIRYKRVTASGRGWPGGPEMRDTNLYFTYTAVVALAAALEKKSAILDKELTDDIEALLKDAQAWVESLSQQNGKEGWVPTDKCEYNEDKHFIYSTYALMTLYTIWDTTGDVSKEIKEIIKNGTEYIIKKWNEGKRKLFDISTEYIHLEEAVRYTGKFTDRCTLPNSVWCLCKAYQHNIWDKEMLEKIIPQQLEMLRETFVLLTGDRWSDSGIDELNLSLPSGEIYYTLRTIESLCEYYLNVERITPFISIEDTRNAQELYAKLKEIFQPEKVSNIENRLNKIEAALEDIKSKKDVSKEAILERLKSMTPAIAQEVKKRIKDENNMEKVREGR